ncbi:hypothetical protein RWE15_02280 [Virgibacillus halophilus]|uniref:Uncharacterized protein n=1 Tax=Tigheibacillus halophilus TaxID=361280 RepID=A0ABU5C2D8_9BACI|nr:hypothetical protein [Virgibacillus halophilus]
MLENDMIDHFLNDLSTEKIDKQYLQSNGWDKVDREELARYFVALRKHFNAMKKVIQFLSGSMILLQSSYTAKEEIYRSVSFAKNLLSETKEAILHISIPKPLLQHYHEMCKSMVCIERAYAELQLEERIYYLQEAEIKKITHTCQICK